MGTQFPIYQKSCLSLTVYLILVIGFMVSPVYADDIVFTEDFSIGWGNWSTTFGVWDVGTPTVGPGACHSGVNCAGTNLHGNYPDNTDSRLVSEIIVLPVVIAEEELHLRFWHWFSYGAYDAGRVNIQVYDEGTGVWGSWVQVGGDIVDRSNWSLAAVDLTTFAGDTVRLAFYHYSNSHSPGIGWYVDDIEIVACVPEFTGGFETGWGDWSASRGVWQVGTPTYGPSECHSGVNCAGTHLDGNYPDNTDTRLVSPTFVLPVLIAEEELQLRFWHWFSYGAYDAGRVNIQVYDEGTGVWGAWEQVGGDIESRSNWSLAAVDLTSYAGDTVRLAFFHVSNSHSPGIGWFIDDIEVVAKVPEFTGGFETGWGDWSATRGVWQVGPPTAGPSACHSGVNCAGTHLDSNYPDNTDSRLVSPTFVLPEVTGGLEELQLRFWHWFSYGAYDAGRVNIQVYDEGTGVWGVWEQLGGDIVSSSGWALVALDIASYSGETVRLAFFHVSNSHSPGIGWFIDEVTIVGSCSIDFAPTTDLVCHYYSNILDRQADYSGMAFWNMEMERVEALDIDIGEGFIALAKLFFNSTEYLNQATTDGAYVEDLYETFFQRPPDPGGDTYWQNQLAGGVSRNTILNYFVFSTEFANFLDSFFGLSVARPESNMVNDSYRGILSRLPDSSGCIYWLGQFRTVQCGSDEQGIRNEAYNIASDFFGSAEYLSRSRDDAGFVEDVYDAIVRRFGDAGGVAYWINQLGTGARTRAEVLAHFVASMEFQSRVDDVIAAGCYSEP